MLETALAYTNALRMADNAILFKLTAKSVGMKYNIIPSFMAKPWNGVSYWVFTLIHCLSVLFKLPGCSGSVEFQADNAYRSLSSTVIATFHFGKMGRTSLPSPSQNLRLDELVQQIMTRSLSAKKRNGSLLASLTDLEMASCLVHPAPYPTSDSYSSHADGILCFGF